jgi:hypothetical protein
MLKSVCCYFMLMLHCRLLIKSIILSERIRKPGFTFLNQKVRFQALKFSNK